MWRRPRDRVRPTFFRSGARGLHVPAKLTREPTRREARKRRASERPRVACCEELAARHGKINHTTQSLTRRLSAALK
jgi:hypothetical protein